MYKYDYIHENSHDEIRKLLIGRTVEKVSEDTLRLDDGTMLRIKGNEGGCSCGAGDYELTELNECPINMITAVDFVNDPSSDDGEGEGYSIFVLAHDERIKLAQIDGTDGNGYYGTGYRIEVF